jgi:hypothetical protein
MNFRQNYTNPFHTATRKCQETACSVWLGSSALSSAREDTYTARRNDQTVRQKYVAHSGAMQQV